MSRGLLLMVIRFSFVLILKVETLKTADRLNFQKKSSTVEHFYIFLINSIQKLHASLKYDNDEVVLKPLNQGAKTKVNGTPLTGEQKLEHNDRVLFGKLILQD